ncbi:MAG: tetratricopeptide repeat protein [Hyphomonadaceae bacterium]
MGLFGPSPTLNDRGIDAFEKGEWKRARRLLEDAADERRASGDYYLGLLYWRGLGGERDTRAAVACFERAALDAYPPAQTAYGMALRSGIGVPKDDAAAMTHFRSAAGAGDRDAMIQLATMSEPDDARRWLLRAAELGHTPAMMNLSDLLMRKDAVDALAWLYTAVAVTGDDAARKCASKLAREMTAKEIETAQKTGRAYAKAIRDQARAAR